MTTATIQELQDGEIQVIDSVSWAKKPMTLKKQSFPAGKVPKHLEPYIFKKNDVVRECVNSISKDIIGREKIQAINECVSQKLTKK